MVAPQLWQSRRFLSLNDAERLLFLYLVSGPHQTSAGCYRLPPAYAANDLGWVVSDYIPRLEALIRAGLVQADIETCEVLIERWFRHNRPANPKWRQGVMRAIAGIQSPALRDLATDGLAEADAAYASKAKTSLPMGSQPYSLAETAHLLGRKNGLEVQRIPYRDGSETQRLRPNQTETNTRDAEREKDPA
jgi:hypothetical protein